MLQTSSLPLKILYHLTGFPLVLLIILSPNKMEMYPQKLVWWALIGITLITLILLEKEKYETGTIAASWKTTLLAILATGAFGFFFYLKFI